MFGANVSLRPGKGGSPAGSRELRRRGTSHPSVRRWYHEAPRSEQAFGSALGLGLSSGVGPTLTGVRAGDGPLSPDVGRSDDGRCAHRDDRRGDAADD